MDYERCHPGVAACAAPRDPFQALLNAIKTGRAVGDGAPCSSWIDGNELRGRLVAPHPLTGGLIRPAVGLCQVIFPML